MTRGARLALAVLLALASACAHRPERAGDPGQSRRGTVADSVTVGLWNMNETGGTRVADAGPFRLDGLAGPDTRTDFGRDRNARLFTRSLNSFVWVPWNPVLDLPGPLTIEAWIFPGAYGNYEDTPIAARWTPLANEQSWLFTVLGRRVPFDPTDVGPEYHHDLVRGAGRGQLMFAYQPEDAGPARSFYSSRAILLERWTHVAVTFDGEVVRFYVDGLLDSQYAAIGRIRRSEAPLLVGNFFDPRGLTDFGGDLRAGPALGTRPWYAFEGFIDELRISNAARRSFESLRR